VIPFAGQEFHTSSENQEKFLDFHRFNSISSEPLISSLERSKFSRKQFGQARFRRVVMILNDIYLFLLKIITFDLKCFGFSH